MRFNELYPTLEMTCEEYFNEFRDVEGDLAVGAAARFVLKGSEPRRCAYVLTSKVLNENTAETEEKKEYYHELNNHEFYFIVLFEEDNSKSIVVPDETFSDLEDVRLRAQYLLQRYNPELVGKQKDVLENLQ